MLAVRQVQVVLTAFLVLLLLWVVVVAQHRLRQPSAVQVVAVLRRAVLVLAQVQQARLIRVLQVLMVAVLQTLLLVVVVVLARWVVGLVMRSSIRVGEGVGGGRRRHGGLGSGGRSCRAPGGPRSLGT